MVCEHLRAIEEELLRQGRTVLFRGAAWSRNCREWVYFDCFIDTASVSKNFALPACVREHAHRGTHDGQERGFECTLCHDGIMGAFEATPRTIIFKG